MGDNQCKYTRDILVSLYYYPLTFHFFRYPIQLVFDTEDQAAHTIAKLKNAGFIMEPQEL